MFVAGGIYGLGTHNAFVPVAVCLPTAIADRSSLWLLLPIATCDRAYDWKLHCHREVADNATTPALASSKNCSAAVRSLMQSI
jgi:hypothetical protein